jgi:nickel/cobalt exporter
MPHDGFSLSLLLAAAGVAIVHTVLGPDHFLPFVMLGRARRWTPLRAAVITAACGVGHVASSLLLGIVGLGLGVGVGRLQHVESLRGDVAAGALLAFGLAYAVWGIRRALRQSRGIVLHDHDGHVHVHVRGDHAHGHAGQGKPTTFWVLFIVFVLGPCEPLIPLFMLPASRGRWADALATGILFGVLTVGAMVVLVLLGRAGLRRIATPATERWAHAMAGGVIALSGAAVLFLGL